MQKSGSYALVTGASQGIGRAIARECATRGLNLVLVALPESGLEALSEELAASCGVQVFPLCIDFCVQGSSQKVFEYCQIRNLPVGFLVNNVGMGSLGSFESMPFRKIEAQVRLNVLTATELCWFFLPMLRENAPHCILNVGSLAAFSPAPFKSVYSASKRYVHNFSLALREELRGVGVNVSVLNPGTVLTNPNTIMANERLGRLSRMGVVPVELLAARAISAALRGKAVIIPGVYNRVVRFLQTILPVSLTLRLSTRIFRKTQKGANKISY